MVMRKEYDFSKGIRNPYIKKLKKPVTIRIEVDTIEYFKKSASEIDIPYQKLINLFLRDCALTEKKLTLQWQPSYLNRSNQIGRQKGNRLIRKSLRKSAII
jgi:hypothetical protein